MKADDLEARLKHAMRVNEHWAKQFLDQPPDWPHWQRCEHRDGRGQCREFDSFREGVGVRCPKHRGERR